MLEWLTQPKATRRKAVDLYGMVVAAARQPAFYGPARVPDTPEGRFELIALHLFLVAERLTAVKPDGEHLARHMIEAFVVDMDDCMREMGVGDLTVPKRVKRAAAVFYEQSGRYRDALAVSVNAPGDADPLDDVIARSLLQSAQTSSFSADVCAYVRASTAALKRMDYADVADGKFAFATPTLAEH